jgi:ATP-binding cassette subfamily C (CFTR/MRP) protein 1
METILTFAMWLSPKMILVATFGTFVALGGDLTSPIAFSFMCLFSYIQFYLQFLPNALSIVVESFNGIKRV